MTRRTAFKGSSAARRRERLKAQAIAQGVEARAEVISSEKLHRPTLSRAQLQAKGKHETPKRIEDAKPIYFIAQDALWNSEESKIQYKRKIEDAANMYAKEFGNKIHQMEAGVCMQDVAIFAAGHRKSNNVTAR